MSRFSFDRKHYKRLEARLIEAGGPGSFKGPGGAQRLLEWLGEIGVEFDATDWRLAMLEAAVGEATKFVSTAKDTADGARALAQFLTLLQSQSDVIPQHDPIRS